MAVVLSNIDEIALELDQRAVQVEMAGAELVRAAAEAIWTSIAADAFRARVDHRRRQFGDVADLLRAAAQSVFRYSDEVVAERARLRRLELDAEHALSRGAVDARKVGGLAVGVVGHIHL
jgi:hypothetical protein